MISVLCYIIVFYNIDTILKNIYVPYIIHNNYNNTYDIISNYKELYFLLNLTSYFMLGLYSYTLLYRLLVSKINDKNCVSLSFIYIKHIIDIIISPKMTIIEYELSRSIMWVFTTPLMLKMYCDSNNLTLHDINFKYNIISIIGNVFLLYFKYNTETKAIYYGLLFITYIPMVIFLKTLNKYRHMSFTNLYMLIWIIFMGINLLEVGNLFDISIIYSLFNLADTLCKFICNVVISNYNEQKVILHENIDLQSIKFLSCLIKSIKDFKNNNTKLTHFCNNLIQYYNKKLSNKIPKINDKLKLELLKKILPFELDADYMKINNNSRSSINKEFNFICVMFMDIVNYTELANMYKSGDIIFRLLDDIYHHFDNIIKKYSNLQKIETIGDSYMVVGDIYRQELNYKIVVKEIILLGLEFIKEIKTIKTPNDIPLCIRIGINIGNVNIGILGNEIPRLCVVGNTVNVASRLQSTADSDSIQISRHVYEQVIEISFDKNIDFIEKNNVFLKNIGTCTTYNIMNE